MLPENISYIDFNATEGKYNYRVPTAINTAFFTDDVSNTLSLTLPASATGASNSSYTYITLNLFEA